MPSPREADPRIGCLALPLGGVAGFVVVVLVAAAAGVGATGSTVAGVVGALVGLLVAGSVVARTGPRRRPRDGSAAA